MDETQDIIDALIDHIDKAILKHSVSNRQVATVLEFLNQRLKALSVVDLESLQEMFLRKDQEDSTDFLLTFGNFIDSITAGRGAGIFPDGRAQFNSVEVRNSLKVLELIFNRLSAQESDTVFTEAGTVDEFEQLDATTYRLTMRKRHDNDFTAFREGDVVRGVVNNLSSTTKEYNTSFVRVLSVNTVANTIEVSVYPDSEVPSGKNHPPTALMVLQRWGNTFDNERQSCWYISSSEGRIVWLTGVTKPILEDHNYASFYGKPVHLAILEGKAIDYNQPYFYARGVAVQDLIRVDYQGNVIKDFRDRGSWVADPAEPYRNMDALQDDVWHHGCKWRCLIDQTTQEPRWNATDWQMIEGNSNLSMQFGSSAGDMFFAGQVSTAVTPYVYLGNIDISADVLSADWQWTRDSGNVTEDNAWSIAHATNGRVLQLGNEDMGSNWSVTRKVAFICTAYVRDGSEIYGIENRLIV